MVASVIPQALVVAHDNPNVSMPRGWNHSSRATPEELGVWDKFCQMNSDLASMEKPVEVSKQEAPGFQYTFTFSNRPPVNVYEVPWLRDLVVQKLIYNPNVSMPRGWDHGGRATPRGWACGTSSAR